MGIRSDRQDEDKPAGKELMVALLAQFNMVLYIVNEIHQLAEAQEDNWEISQKKLKNNERRKQSRNGAIYCKNEGRGRAPEERERGSRPFTVLLRRSSSKELWEELRCLIKSPKLTRGEEVRLSPKRQRMMRRKVPG